MENRFAPEVAIESDMSKAYDGFISSAIWRSDGSDGQDGRAV